MTRAFSGRPLEEITLERIVSGEIEPDDVRVHPQTLRHQAEVAEAAGNRQLGENLRRAAELATLPERRVLEIYEALRPRRSHRADLERIADELDAAGAPGCAALVREALEAYSARGLLL
jgi:propanediol dehydratase small subunit